jgi:hypothetical protein
MDWNQVRIHLKKMQGSLLPSISGKSDIRVTEIDDEYIHLQTIGGDAKSRPLSELLRVVEKMKLNLPVHVDSALGGSGSSRNQPETILANLPDVEWMRLEARKHLVWLGRKTHDVGTIKEADAFTIATARKALAESSAGALVAPVSIVVFSSHMSRASQLLSNLFQGAAIQPLSRPGVYRVASPQGTAILLPSRSVDDPDPKILSCVSAPNADEAANRIRAVYPDSTVEVVSNQPRLLLVKLHNGSELVLTDSN